MHETASAMLQQNNNNNYPCLSMSASTQEMLQKCSKTSLPLPGRLELSLGDLPLIRGLRAWALCSKNRRRTGNLLEGGRKAPGAPPPVASCPRPADVHLSRECWGLGMDTRQARIGALVTVATLKTSEGGGKTQTQCLFLRTEKGSCLYSTRKPGSAVPPLGGKGWLGGKTGGKDVPAGRREAGTASSLHAETNWVRVRSGRRWRKSGNVSDMSRVRQQSRKDVGDGLRMVDKRQDEQRIGNLDLQELELQKDQQSLGGGIKSHGHQSTHRSSPQSFHVGTKREVQNEEELKTSPNKDEDTDHDTLKFLSGNEDHVSREKPNAVGKTYGAATDGSPSSSMSCESSNKNDNDGERLAEERQDKGSLDHQELEKSLGGGIESHGSQSTRRSSTESFHVGKKKETESEKELQSSPNKDDHSLKHKDANQEALRFLLGDADLSPDVPDSTEKRNAEDKTCAVATNGSIFSSMSHDNGLRLAEEKQDEERNGNLDRQELEKQQDQQILGGGMESHGSPESFHDGTKKEAQSEKDLQTSPIKDVHSSKHEDTNHDASGKGDPPLDSPVSTEKLNTEGQTCGAATREQISYCAVANKETEHESTSPSIRSESSEFGQSEPEDCCQSKKHKENPEGDLHHPYHDDDDDELDFSMEKENQDQSQRFSSQTDPEVSPSIPEQETQDRLEPDQDERTCRTLIKEDGGGERKRRTQDEETKVQKPAEQNQEADTELSNPPTSHSHSRANPASFPTLTLNLLPEGSTAAGGGGRSLGSELESEETTTSTVASEKDEDVDEEEFGGFMQAEGQEDWDQGLKTPVHCGSRESVGQELGNSARLSEDPSHWTAAGWMDGSFHQWDDSWTAFSQDASEKGGDVGQWWPVSAAEQRRDISTNQDLTSVFAQAFPSLSSSSPCDPSVSTLSELLRGGARHDQGLLDGFHDLDKMIGRRFKRANAASRDLLLRTLQLEPLKNENRHPSSRRLSPGLPSANQHAHSAVPKRRLSYDSNRNVTA